MRTDRTSFLNVQFDRLSFEDIKDRLYAAGKDSPYAYVVTPNVDHVVRLHREPELSRLYEEADFCLCDSRVLKLLARIRGIKLPLVTGSDLTETIFSRLIRPADAVGVVGCDRDSLQQLRAKFPGVHFLHFQPPMRLRDDPEARRAAAEFVATSNARFTFIAVGSPQQEMIANEVSEHPDATGVALCIGAGLDFVLGNQKRAPRLVQRLGLEWAHRLITNPRRLWRRYLVDGMRIFPIYIRWRRSDRRPAIFVMALSAALLILAYTYFIFENLDLRHPATITLPVPPAASQSMAAIEALPPPNLLKPLSPAEASEQNAERPFADRPDSPASRFLLRTDADDANRALNCLAQAVYYEAAGEGVEGGRAVAQVVLNRVRHPGFPTTICGVVYQGSDRPTGCQFSFTCDGSLQRIPVPALWARSKKIAEEALKGKVFGPVGHATHYHADYVLPYWADSLDKSVQIGRHIFYRLRSSLGDPRAFSQHYGGTEPPFRVPGSVVVLPPTGETQELTKALIGNGAEQLPAEVEKASPPPNSPLLIDSRHGTLLADGSDRPAAQATPSKSKVECSAAGDRKKLSALPADDLRASADDTGC